MDNLYGVDISSLSEKEKEEVLKILNEVSTKGKSDTYTDMIYADYEEIPVDIETFLHNPKYLGKGLINEEGKYTVFPYWEDVLKKIFPDPLKPAQYNTLALTGAIGLGKSFEAVLTGLYELYRMLCLRDPYLYYGLQPIDKISFALLNITMDAAQGVGWDKFQQLAQSSEWFMNYGTVSRGNNPTWSPSKKIELICGSQSRHIIGRAVFWCLDGDTIILTSEGDQKISELVDKPIIVPTVDNRGNIVNSELCTVKQTAESTVEYQIELENGCIVKCTPNHRFMLTDGTYKEAKDLTENDDILEFVPVGYVYKTTNNINGHIYIGKRQSKSFDTGYLGSVKRLCREVNKYGKENFTCEILQWAQDKSELEKLEEYYIEMYFNLPECINCKKTSTGGDTVSGTFKITNGVEERNIQSDECIPEGWHLGSKMKGVPHPSIKYSEIWTEERRKMWSEKFSGINNPNYGKGCFGSKNGRYGKPCPEHVKEATRLSNKGKHHSEEVNKSKGRPGIKKPPGFGERISNTTKGKKGYTNGVVNIWVMKDEEAPEGFRKGWVKHENKIDNQVES